MRRSVPQVEVSGVPEPLPPELCVLDVRENDEWAEGHIDGALHIPLMQVAQRLSELPSDGQVLVVCAVGARSARATAFLQGQGIDAVNLAGGMRAWQAAGRQLAHGRSGPG